MATISGAPVDSPSEGYPMEPTPAKPLRKRRRWLAIAFVLVLGSLCTWWHWPRGDARFVGKWEVYSAGEDMAPTGTIRLRRSGIADIHEIGSPVHIVRTWAVVDSNLVFGLEEDRWWFDIANSVTNGWNAAFGTSYEWFGCKSLPIKAVGRDEFRLGHPSYDIGMAGQPDVTYRRIPE